MEVFIFCLPLFGALFCGLFCLKVKPFVTELVTTACVFLSFCLSCILFYKMYVYNVFEVSTILFNWIDLEMFQASWGVFIDRITAIMLIVVTSVAFVVHLYSIGYMHEDKSRQRFMVYLSLFTFFMLVLVTGSNMLQTFVGWEGVGLCSYLLIGFWYEKESATNAAIKAFVTNRVGDLALIIGLAACYSLFGTLEYHDIFDMLPNFADKTFLFCGVEVNYLTFIAMSLFLGCMGKSAQIGLHVWLPDAMEGPTPVSALIHAATMVTAGVFLVVKCSFLFEYSDFARAFIMIVGAITAIFASTIAITQEDIKKIIAYSTCSQLGYMFFACGAGAYQAGIFHLATHAFFKALLFLCAGSVIHALSGEQNIFKMGGIVKKIPITFALMMVGSIAICGLPPFAGYYSKDAILEAAFASNFWFGQIIYYLGVLTAGITSFYSFRLVILVFFGRSNSSKEVQNHIHESPFVMLLPLFILSVGAVFSGYFGVNILHLLSFDGDFWGGSVVQNQVLEDMHHVPEFVKFLPLVASIFGILLSFLCYFNSIRVAKLPFFYKFSKNKYFFDELYDFSFVKPVIFLSNFFCKYFDKKIVDSLFVGFPSKLFSFLSNASSLLHNGRIVVYFLSIFSFCILLFIYIILYLT